MLSEHLSANKARAVRPEGDASQTGRARGGRHRLLRIGTRLFNPPIRRLAGSPALPLFAVVRHRGRRSGRWYATPTAARPTADGFVVPLTFGQEADWVQNLLAAGGGVIQWKGVDYPVSQPEIVDLATGRTAFSPVLRRLIPLFGIQQFVHLRHAPAEMDGASRDDHGGVV